MIRIAALFLIILNSAIAFGQSAEFSFYKKILKFDAISEGTPLSFQYEFTNSGSDPLIINDYKVQCSCTKVAFPKTPVLPGEKASIQVDFDSTDKIGWQYRTIQLYANVPGGVSELEFRVKVGRRTAPRP